MLEWTNCHTRLVDVRLCHGASSSSRWLKTSIKPSLPPFDFAQDKLRRESRTPLTHWIPAFAGMTAKGI